MSTLTRGAYHHGDLAAALRRAAEDLLDEGGGGAVSLRAAARRAGVSASACYRHYAAKDDLLAAVATQGFAELGAALAAAGAASADAGARGRGGDGDGALAAMAVAYVTFAVARPGRFRLMFGAAPWPRGRHPGLDAAAAASYGALEAAVARTGRDGDGVRAAATGAWALVHGLATLILDGRVPGDDVPGLVRAVLAARGAANLY